MTASEPARTTLVSRGGNNNASNTAQWYPHVQQGQQGSVITRSIGPTQCLKGATSRKMPPALAGTARRMTTSTQDTKKTQDTTTVKGGNNGLAKINPRRCISPWTNQTNSKPASLGQDQWIRQQKEP